MQIKDMITNYKDLEYEYGLQKYSKYDDSILICNVCGKSFVYSAYEQYVYECKGYDKPKKCSNCRKRKRSNKGTSNKGRTEKEQRNTIKK